MSGLKLNHINKMGPSEMPNSTELYALQSSPDYIGSKWGMIFTTWS